MINPFAWIRDAWALLVRKDAVEAKKTKLQIEELESKRRTELLHLAETSDVRRYDPNVQYLIREIRKANRSLRSSSSPVSAGARSLGRGDPAAELELLLQLLDKAIARQ